MKAIKTGILAVVFCTLSMGAAAQHNRPDTIPIPAGFQAEGIALGKGHDFFVGGFSFASIFGPAFFGVPHDLSASAGAIYKGNLRTGEGAILVPPTGKPVSGLSYDHRTDYLYAATGFVDLVNGSFTDQGVIVYDASSGDVVVELGFGDGVVINDVLVTRKAVYFTDSINPWLWKLPLGKGGRCLGVGRLTGGNAALSPRELGDR